MNDVLILSCGSAAMALAVAVIAVWQDKRSLAHWAFGVGMAVLASEAVFAGLSASAIVQERIIYWQNWKFLALSMLPGIWLLFSLSYARGNYREFLSRWRFLLAAAFLVPPALAFGFGGDLIASALPIGPKGEWMIGLGIVGIALNLLLLLSAVLILMNLERTLRASVGTMRWRIKFLVIGLLLLFGLRAYTSTQILLFQGMSRALNSIDAAALLVACILILRSFFRSGNFDVNVYPSHSVLHNSLTILLAGVYLLIVGLFAKVFKGLGGETGFAFKAFLVLMALVILTVVLLSERVRLQTKRFVSRHFQRPIYDYRTLWRSFIEKTAANMDQDELSRVTVRLIADIFQVLSVTIWLVDDKQQKLIFAASTSLSQSRGNQLAFQAGEMSEIIQALKVEPEPVDIDFSKKKWAVALRQCQPEEFKSGGHRVCVPIVVGDEALGLITLGDRVGGVGFSQQDFDLLKCVGDQTAANLRNVQLSQKLLQAKELEAFQTMSAFFVHDLKNTASTLNLMLQNLPVHFADPVFREDALRGISKSVTHINQLISRLSMLRHALKIHAVDYDLNEVVAKSLEAWPNTAGMISRELASLPRVPLDPDQMLKVVTNLVLNATEAIPTGGRIQISTSRNNGWAVLAVTDNGCGMSRDFIDGSLFRPFQTTKKNGLGIGMFQSKMIVEAHGGRIEVESEAAKGSTFRVLLPIHK